MVGSLEESCKLDHGGAAYLAENRSPDNTATREPDPEITLSPVVTVKGTKNLIPEDRFSGFLEDTVPLADDFDIWCCNVCTGIERESNCAKYVHSSWSTK